VYFSNNSFLRFQDIYLGCCTVAAHEPPLKSGAFAFFLAIRPLSSDGMTLACPYGQRKNLLGMPKCPIVTHGGTGNPTFGRERELAMFGGPARAFGASHADRLPAGSGRPS
jgi:hypothetical protein